MTTDIKATLVKLIVLVLLILKLIVKKEAHQDKDKKKYKCDSCGKYFTQKGSLKKHIETKAKEILHVILVVNHFLQ